MLVRPHQGVPATVPEDPAPALPAGRPAASPQIPVPDAPPMAGNLLAGLPAREAGEAFQTLFRGAAVRIERIVSHGHASPEDFWYDQPDDEWVMVVHGEAMLAFGDGRRHAMRAGDWVAIPAHCRHRVASTGPDTVWLAVHADARGGPAL
jgi:cupin 2 domain-containing protein